MKRASLTVAPSPPKTQAADLTDRLLAQETKPAKRAASKSRRPRASKPSSVQSESVPSGSSVDHALAQSRMAVEALRAAAQDTPARYSLALRYRLDALAHHLTQIVEFVEMMKPSQRQE